MDPKYLPEHLQPLMEHVEWISEDITTRDREELAAAIYEYILYRDVFSIALWDMGQTDLVTHTIDTGGRRWARSHTPASQPTSHH